ncbi:uncharacterized protein METZ01_LOCUS474858 [marine metagenome]|uniref:Uncharacterized protein n=1 Tax=marine metagenome TaxID=408172 RepID=A0A383BQ11_9ZZZZ
MIKDSHRNFTIHILRGSKEVYGVSQKILVARIPKL